MAQAMNRALRRRVINEVIKVREQSKVKKQYGIGVVITNLVCSITFWRWTVVLYDRRLK
jgi:hypothetical protein